MIPVFEPLVSEEDIQAVTVALRNGELSGSFGKSIERFETAFADYCGCRYGVVTSSGTTALQLAVAAAGIGPGDEVLVNASTNIATALAVYHNGALTVPVDSDPVSWNLDTDLIESLITPRTRAIIPVHLYGHPVNMPAVQDIARRHRLVVIEDCAEAHGALCFGKKVGGLGDMGCFSFYSNKVITTGEGGMVTTNDKDLAARLKLLRNLAFSEPRFLHQLPGYNFRMAAYQAALGFSQLQRIDAIIEKKRELAGIYNRCLSPLRGLQLPYEAEWAKNIYWMYAVSVRPEFGISRDELANFLRQKGIESRTFFCPMNLQPFLMRQKGFRLVACPVSEDLWKTGIYLPSGYLLTETVIRTIADAIAEARTAKKKGTA